MEPSWWSNTYCVFRTDCWRWCWNGHLNLATLHCGRDVASWMQIQFGHIWQQSSWLGHSPLICGDLTSDRGQHLQLIGGSSIVFSLMYNQLKRIFHSGNDNDFVSFWSLIFLFEATIPHPNHHHPNDPSSKSSPSNLDILLIWHQASASYNVLLIWHSSARGSYCPMCSSPVWGLW